MRVVEFKVVDVDPAPYCIVSVKSLLIFRSLKTRLFIAKEIQSRERTKNPTSLKSGMMILVAAEDNWRKSGKW